MRWLWRCDGKTWDERWLASGFDAAPNSWKDCIDSNLSTYSEGSPAVLGINEVMRHRLVRPSYSWLLNSGRSVNLPMLLEEFGGADLARMRDLPAYRNDIPKRRVDAESALTRILIRTGKSISEVTGDDLLYYSDVVRTSGRQRREHLLWELLVQLGPLADEVPTMRAAWSANGNSRQHSTATLVDRYGIPASGVRDVLVDYLSEIRPGMDYSSVEGVAYLLARLFWWEILQINPHQEDLRIAADVTTKRRERLAITTDGRPRRDVHSILFTVRGFYRDVAEWAYDDPARWGVWVAPCPVPRHLSRAVSKEKHRQKSRMQDRTRMLTPLLPVLVSTAHEQKRRARKVLELARESADGAEFEVDGVIFVRDSPPERHRYKQRTRIWVRLKNAKASCDWIRTRGGRINVATLEADAFWGWAVVETLRHSGIRIEELLEITQLSLRHYKAAQTGTVVPLLHIVPSKNDRERLIPMTPELVQVLVEVLRRTKESTGRVPLSTRYDPHEKLHGQPFPHLFARKIGARQEVLSMHYVRQVLIHLARVAKLTDADEPVHFSPHDFRRLFTTDAVNTGLPLHIAAALLGHLNLDTTRGYTAVFPEHLIVAHQAFIERRRLLRPEAEGQIADQVEWDEFEQHFLLRRVALGECHRPYGTPCVHEHAAPVAVSSASTRPSLAVSRR